MKKDREQPLEYVPIFTDLPRHRKTKRLARLLPDSPLPVHMFLQELFRATGDLYPSGEYPSDFESPDVADLANWPGNPTSWTSALTDAGFLTRADGRWIIPNWREYGGKVLERREKERERKRLERANAAAGRAQPDMPLDGRPSDTGVVTSDARERPPDVRGRPPDIPDAGVVASDVRGRPPDVHGSPAESAYREEKRGKSFSSSSSSAAHVCEVGSISAQALDDAVMQWGWKRNRFPPKHWPTLLEHEPYSKLEVDFARHTVEQKPDGDRSPGLLLKIILDERKRKELGESTPRGPPERARAGAVGYHAGSTVFADGEGDVSL